MGFGFITIGDNRPVKQVNGDRLVSSAVDIFRHGFDIVIQAPPLMDQNNHRRVLFVSPGKTGADCVAI